MKRSKTALVAAVDLLAVRAYSVRALTDKLTRKGYVEEEIQAAVEKLLQRGYLNDESLCRELYRQYVGMKKYSLKQIEYKLRQKGFDGAVIACCRQSGDEVSEEAAALKILRLKYGSCKGDGREMMQRLYAKGFAPHSITAAVAAFTGTDCHDFFDES